MISKEIGNRVASYVLTRNVGGGNYPPVAIGAFLPLLRRFDHGSKVLGLLIPRVFLESLLEYSIRLGKTRFAG
jgi:hypothetical protein